MTRLFARGLQAFGRGHVSVNVQTFSGNVNQLARGNKTHTACYPTATTLPTWTATLLPEQNHQQPSNILKLPEHFHPFSYEKGTFLSIKDINIVRKHLPSLFGLSLFNTNNATEKDLPRIIDEESGKRVYLMGSLLKKRRRKMNRQKYKKRRKRDRFKRAALKNLREKKRQRKERAAARKQAWLSKMVVNKSISKRRARYLSHKLLPGVKKRQSVKYT